MNIPYLRMIQRTIADRSSPGSALPLRTVEEKLDFILFNLAELCIALGTDGTQESIDNFFKEDHHAKT